MGIRFASRVIAAAVLIVCAGARVVFSQDASHYYFFKESRPLIARPGQIAVLQTSRLAADNPVDFVSPVFVDRDGVTITVTPDILVEFNDDVPAQRAEQILAQANDGDITERDWSEMRGAYRIRSRFKRGEDVLDAANALAEQPEVKFAEPDMIFTGHGSLIPNDPNCTRLWGINNTGQNHGISDVDMDGVEAWDITTGSSNIIVVVIDTGVQQDHPDLNQIPGRDFTADAGNGGPVNVCDRHGTAVAGCVAARINNGLGTVGIAPGCRVASARTFISNSLCDGTLTSQSSWTVAGLTWAESIGARVTVNSNGYGFQSSAIAQKYADTRSRGMVHFASVGNGSSTTLDYPASLPGVNAVGAIDRTGKLIRTSNHGTGLAFVAPGASIYTTDRTGAAGFGASDYVTASGTSFAAPYAAGVAALVLSRNSTLTATNVELILQQSCTDFGAAGYDTTFGWGLVNAQRALQLTPAKASLLADPIVVPPSSSQPGDSDDDSGDGDFED